MTSILVIDDEPRVAETLRRLAPEWKVVDVEDPDSGRKIAHARSWDAAERILKRRLELDAVVLDLRFEIADERLLPGRRPLGDGPRARRLRRETRERQGLFILERLRRERPDLPVILTTAYAEIPYEEEAVRLRADALVSAVPEEASGAALVRHVRAILDEAKAPLRTGAFLWGRGVRMRELRRKVAALAPTPLPVLLLGETGTGKNLLAREVLHPGSGRKGACVAFDCATVPADLLASALFGVVRGAFTGAVVDRPGVFEAARDGTLYIDEIENLREDAQKMLLTALNDGTIRRVGSSAEIRHAARIVAASNTDLRRRAAGGEFRSDLLMRLNPALALELPPLRERRDDLPELAAEAARAFFRDPAHRPSLDAAARSAGRAFHPGEAVLAIDDERNAESEASIVFRIPPKAWRALAAAPWPGNLRQFTMTIADLLASALYAGAPETDRGRLVLPIDVRLAYQLLAGAAPIESGEAPWAIPRRRARTVAEFRQQIERDVYRALFREVDGDFGRLAESITGSRKDARAARLRFNRLGLSARRDR